jgi:hypothetical protein
VLLLLLASHDVAGPAALAGHVTHLHVGPAASPGALQYSQVIHCSTWDEASVPWHMSGGTGAAQVEFPGAAQGGLVSRLDGCPHHGV